MSHTPGPWSVRIRSAYTGNYIVLEAGPAEDADNARLIAAAPEMLALLRNVLDLTAGYPYGRACEEGRALLKRLEGV